MEELLSRFNSEAMIVALTGGDLPGSNQHIIYREDVGWVFDDHPRPSDWTTISASAPSGTPTYGTGSLWVKTA